MKVTGIEIVGKKISFAGGATEITVEVRYAEKVLRLEFPVSSGLQDAAAERQELERALLEFGCALIEAATSLR